MKTVVIGNPTSAAGKAGELWPRVDKAVTKALGPHESVLTQKPGHATQLARKALDAGFERILAYGGDGTVNEVVNGLFEGGQLRKKKIVLGLIPAGTGGDFRRSLGLTGKVAHALEVIAQGHREQIDVGWVRFQGNGGQTEERHFANMTGIGLSGEIMRKVNAARRSKALGATLVFKWAAFTSMLGRKNQMMRIEIDGHAPVYETACSVHVCNGRYAGGGMMFAPHAELNDGLLDVVLFGDFKAFNFMVESKALYRGKHLDNPMVSHFQGREINISSESEVMLEIDGETPGVLPAHFTVVDKALTVFCPPNFGRKDESGEKPAK